MPVENCVNFSRVVSSGRRPKSLARCRFMELLNRGVFIPAACWEIGVCRQTVQNWKNGVTVSGKDGLVKHVLPLQSLSTRLMSPRYLSEAERVLYLIYSVKG